MKAQNVSNDNSGPWMGPDIFDSTLQFVPNWNPHHESRHYSKAKGDAEYLEPELEQRLIHRAAGSQVQRLKNGEPRGKADGECGENDVERDGETKLYP